MKKKVKTKMLTLSKKIGSVLIALSMITGACAPAVTSFTQAQPVAKKKAKIKKKKKAKKRAKKRVKTKTLKTVTLAKGKSKTISVKSKRKVTWKTSNKSVATVKSAGKSKVKITAKKAGSAKVTGNAKGMKWNVKVKVKGNKKPTPKPSGTSSKKSKTNTAKKTASQAAGHAHMAASNITLYLDDPGILSVSSMDTKVKLQIDDDWYDYKKIKWGTSDSKVFPLETVEDSDTDNGMTASCIHPTKIGECDVTATYLGKNYVCHVKTVYSEAHDAAMKVISENITPGMSDLDKVMTIAYWWHQNVTYDLNADTYNSLDLVFLEHRGVCGDFSFAFKYLMDHIGVKCRVIHDVLETHAHNQVIINGKWYNMDMTGSVKSNLGLYYTWPQSDTEYENKYGATADQTAREQSLYVQNVSTSYSFFADQDWKKYKNLSQNERPNSDDYNFKTAKPYYHLS